MGFQNRGCVKVILLVCLVTIWELTASFDSCLRILVSPKWAKWGIRVGFKSNEGEDRGTAESKTMGAL